MRQPYTLETLATIEQIKGLKARYTLFLDAHAFDLCKQLFVEDAVFTGDVSQGEIQGTTAFFAELARRRGGERMAHPAIPMVVEMLTPDTARGLWRLGTALGTWGFYEDEFVNVNATWKISELRLIWLQRPGLLRAGDYEDVEATLAALAVRWADAA